MPDRFLDRMGQTKAFDEAFLPFLEEHGVRTWAFGQTTLLRGSPLVPQLRRLMVSRFDPEALPAGFMIKFSPDYVCVPEHGNGDAFFLDTKASVIPVLFESYLASLRTLADEGGAHDLTRGDVGEIEREAWDVYRTYYPRRRTAIAFAAPYHPRLVVLDWVDNIMAFFRYSSDRNQDSGGSGTPHVNIHLGRMRTPAEFLRDEFGVNVSQGATRALCAVVKSWPIVKPKGRVNWAQFRGALARIRMECPWALGQFPDGVDHPEA